MSYHFLFFSNWSAELAHEGQGRPADELEAADERHQATRLWLEGRSQYAGQEGK